MAQALRQLLGIATNRPLFDEGENLESTSFLFGGCMIEVEKKFKLEGSFFEKILREGTFLKQKKFHDTYYDTHDWKYTVQNKWLRNRDSKFELKVAVEQARGTIDRYDEITDPMTILEALGLPLGPSISKALEESGIVPFCSFSTDRRKYQLGEFTIDVDRATFNDLSYAVAEIEILVQDVTRISDAENKIIRFLENESVDWRATVYGKLSYFLRHINPSHFRALVNARVIRENESEFYATN